MPKSKKVKESSLLNTSENIYSYLFTFFLIYKLTAFELQNNFPALLTSVLPSSASQVIQFVSNALVIKYIYQLKTHATIVIMLQQGDLLLQNGDCTFIQKHQK